jgi:hypothetical protein
MDSGCREYQMMLQRKDSTPLKVGGGGTIDVNSISLVGTLFLY